MSVRGLDKQSAVSSGASSIDARARIPTTVFVVLSPADGRRCAAAEDTSPSRSIRTKHSRHSPGRRCVSPYECPHCSDDRSHISRYSLAIKTIRRFLWPPEFRKYRLLPGHSDVRCALLVDVWPRFLELRSQARIDSQRSCRAVPCTCFICCILS